MWMGSPAHRAALLDPDHKFDRDRRRRVRTGRSTPTEQAIGVKQGLNGRTLRHPRRGSPGVAQQTRWPKLFIQSVLALCRSRCETHEGSASLSCWPMRPLASPAISVAGSDHRSCYPRMLRRCCLGSKEEPVTDSGQDDLFQVGVASPVDPALGHGPMISRTRLTGKSLLNTARPAAWRSGFTISSSSLFTSTFTR